MVKGKGLIALGIACIINFIPLSGKDKIQDNKYESKYSLEEYMGELRGEKNLDVYVYNNSPEDYMAYKIMLFDYLDILKDLGGDRQDKIKKCKEYLAKNYYTAMKKMDKDIAMQLDPNLKDLKKNIIFKLKQENIKPFPPEKAL
jgi:hypothetical protein